eukprot:TRINITY_DN1210_c0_g3_i1.p1 TRINITY_DN1210_c0_g3~~TRINITY_DN1210_c0_g3_i1.p1  ORF type:complete len:303 (+),score=121.27 TRINITY_DN1210_c0_g3_i1:77-985(+)
MADAEKSALAEAAKQKGNACFKEGDYAAAAGHYSEAIEHNPSDAVLYSNRSACHASLKQFEEALRDANKVISLRADWGKGYSRKAAALAGMKRKAEARTAALAGLTFDPENEALKQMAADIVEEDESEEEEEEGEEGEEQEDSSSECFEGSLDGADAPDDAHCTARELDGKEFDTRLRKQMFEKQNATIRDYQCGHRKEELERIAAEQGVKRMKQQEESLRLERKMAAMSAARERGEQPQEEPTGPVHQLGMRKKRRVDPAASAATAAPAVLAAAPQQQQQQQQQLRDPVAAPDMQLPPTEP